MSELAFFRYNRTGTELLGQFTSGVRNYRQQWIEGPSEASWQFEPDDPSGVLFWFQNTWMNQVRVRSGGVEVWRGWIYSIDATSKGAAYYASMSDVYNRVMVKISGTDENNFYPRELMHTDGQGNEYYRSWWATHQSSYDEYGPMEQVLNISAIPHANSQAEARQYADGVLARHHDPRYTAAPSYPAGEQGNKLSVTAIGAIGLANRVLLSDRDMLRTYTSEEPDGPDDAIGRLRWAGGGTEYDDLLWGATTIGSRAYTVGDEINRIVRVINAAWGNNGTVMYPLSIAANNTPTAAGCSSITGAWDRLRELATVPNQDGGGYVLSLTVDGGVIYKPMAELDVAYHAYPTSMGLRYPDGSVPGWEARPGIVKEIGWFGFLPATKVDNPRTPESTDDDTVLSPEAYLPPGQSYAERVDMNEGEERPSLSPRKITPADYRRAMETEIRRYGQGIK